jgi:hypothetical protein
MKRHLFRLPPNVQYCGEDCEKLAVTNCQSYTQNGTSAAQHKTQGKRKADRWKKDYERRREEHKTLLSFPSPKSLNYYWLLIFYLNIVHLCGPITCQNIGATG